MTIKKTLKSIGKAVFVELVELLLKGYDNKELKIHLKSMHGYSENSISSRVSSTLTLYNDDKTLKEALSEEYFNDKTKIKKSVYDKVKCLRKKLPKYII